MSSATRMDLHAWLEFSSDFNGFTIFRSLTQLYNESVESSDVSDSSHAKFLLELWGLFSYCKNIRSKHYSIYKCKILLNMCSPPPPPGHVFNFKAYFIESGCGYSTGKCIIVELSFDIDLNRYGKNPQNPS